MPEWLTERGIGETRMALVDGDDILEAQILLEGIAVAGRKLPARLVSVGPNAIARDESGQEYLLPNGAAGISEGAKLDIVVTRSAIPGTEPWKRPLARVAGQSDGPADPVAASAARLPESWNDLVEEARSGVVRFDGGELRISPTPAMTLIDVDGRLPAEELAVAGAAQAAKAIRRLDIGGSIGIDLPTVGGRASRQAAGAAIDANLAPPFERTAVNGFGFVQIVRPRARASLVELAQDRGPFEARALLRRAALETPGAMRLVAHPAVATVLQAKPEWLAELARQVGGAVSLRAEPALPMSGGYAEKA
ncbi:MAG: ribonuclease [Sphingomicrobium sp.]